jgi:hypothetical protein
MRLKVLIAAAAVLVSGTPVLAQDASRPATRPASSRSAAERRARWIADRKVLTRGFPVDPALLKAPAPTDGYDSAYVVRAGDLDGDKRDDVVDVRQHIVFGDTSVDETLHLDAFRGFDGKALWTIDVPAAYMAIPVFTKVGANGKDGVLIATYTATGADVVIAGGGALDSTITAYDGAGKSLWSHTAKGVGGGTPLTYSEAVAPGFAGLGNFVAGGGLDILSVQYDYTEGDVIGLTWVAANRVQPGVIDAATGIETPLGAGFVSDDIEAWVVPVGDLDKDKRDDIAAVNVQAGKRIVSLVSSATGAVLSSPTGIPEGDYLDLYGVADVSGDGVSDVIASAQTYGWTSLGGSPSTPDAGTVALIDGAKGKVAWSKSGTDVVELGNADKKPGGELAVGSLTGNGTGISVAAFNGAGKAVWSVKRKLGTGGLSGYDAWSSWGYIGDTQGDGVRDLGYGVYLDPHGPAKLRRDEGTIDGRTGRVRKDPVPDLNAVSSALDGHGSDSVARPWAKGVMTLTAWRGDRAQRLWQTAFVAPASGYATSGGFLDGDKCADLLVRTSGWPTKADYLISGATGLPLWGVSRGGQAKGKVFRPVVKSHTRYVKTC